MVTITDQEAERVLKEAMQSVDEYYRQRGHFHLQSSVEHAVVIIVRAGISIAVQLSHSHPPRDQS